MNRLSLAAFLGLSVLVTACAPGVGANASGQASAEATLDQDLNGDGLIRGDDLGSSRSRSR